MDLAVHGDSQRPVVPNPIKQVIEYVKEVGYGAVLCSLLCFMGVIEIVTGMVVNQRPEHGGQGLYRGDWMIVMGAMLVVSAMKVWYRLDGNVSTMELHLRENNRN